MRDTLLVGSATFLVGSALMEIGDGNKEVGWWPYVGTFISGALGFYIVTATNMVKVEEKPKKKKVTMEDFRFLAEGPTDDELEAWSERQDDGSMLVMIDEDGDSHTELTYDEEGDLTNLKRFMAEVFEATKKPRRRTTLTWTRGIDPKYRDDFDSGNYPYNVPNYYSSTYKDSNAYHIKELPEGYALHLWKPLRRGYYWRGYAKSPHSPAWERFDFYRKSGSIQDVLSWYNNQIAIPETKELSPFEIMLQQQGVVSDDIIIKRVEPTPERVQYFYEGGPAKYAPTKFAEVQKWNNELEFFNQIPTSLLNFCRGLIYVGWEKDGTMRSVNRYNADRKQWVASHPAWFQNMVKQKVKQLYFDVNGRGQWRINGTNFLIFSDSSWFPYAVKRNKRLPDGNLMFAVVKEGENGIIVWEIPRPTTQMKMYASYHNMEGEYPIDNSQRGHIFNECVAKYNPQKYEQIHDSMLNGSVVDNSLGFYSESNASLKGTEKAGHLMLRRFKKK